MSGLGLHHFWIISVHCNSSIVKVNIRGNVWLWQKNYTGRRWRRGGREFIVGSLFLFHLILLRKTFIFIKLFFISLVFHIFFFHILVVLLAGHASDVAWRVAMSVDQLLHSCDPDNTLTIVGLLYKFMQMWAY